MSSSLRPLSLVVLSLVACAAPLRADDDLLRLPMRDVVLRASTDLSEVERFHHLRSSSTRLDRLDALDADWAERIAARPAEAEHAARVDHALLTEHLRFRLSQRARERTRLEEQSALMPFAEELVGLEQDRWILADVDPRDVAGRLDALADDVDALRERVTAVPGDSGDDGDDGDDVDDVDDDPTDTDDGAPTDASTDADDSADDAPLPVSDVTARRVASRLGELRRALRTWHEHHAAYRPDFAWWTQQPFERLDRALGDYAGTLRGDIAGIQDEPDDPLIGDPIGREALLDALRHEAIPYTPEELLALGEAQLQWCEAELARAAEELGFGDDTAAALAHVKASHVDPGEQDRLVQRFGNEAMALMDARDLVTIPPLCRELWRIDMLSADSQRVLPYAAYGGQNVLVAYPTRDMDHDAKLQSLRGNNEHFTRIVTPHELVPGHHLQGFMAARHATHRRPFSTPFYGEGWALYWELRLWELGWARSPEDRIGMLFWRMHRAARIVVSLGFHLGRMTPDEMIDLLVERVGHEQDGATSEVRRYVGDGYGPLYQCAYLVGGLQFRALHRELVEQGDWTERAYHDAILRQGSMPVAMIRAALTGGDPNTAGEWRFLEE